MSHNAMRGFPGDRQVYGADIAAEQVTRPESLTAWRRSGDKHPGFANRQYFIIKLNAADGILLN
jgi:hypothetical protein